MQQTTLKYLMVIIFGAVIAVGTSLSGYFIGRAIERFKTSDRAVTVKGFSEREVKSDLAELFITFKNAENDLISLQQKNDQDKKNIIEFLIACGVKETAITFTHTELFDRLTYEYADKEKKHEFRYISTNELKVTLPNVDIVATLMGQTTELVKKQISLSLKPRYYFTKFAELRTEMIAEATQRAREAALQFAKDSGSKVDVIRSANQGAFTITSVNDDYNETSSLQKKVRVVNTVVFNLVD